MEKAGKVWGSTIQIRPGKHHIFVKKGSFCSKHKHRHKANWFYVVTGLLRISVWKNDYDLIDDTVLAPGDYCVVHPGEFHRFQALQETNAIEGYFVELDDNDIERETVGGVVE